MILQDNPLLNQLKQQIHAQKKRVEGIVKSTDKEFGFLDIDAKTRYFIPPAQMKKVFNGDHIMAIIENHNGKEFAEPESLISTPLTRFIGTVSKNNHHLFVRPNDEADDKKIVCQADNTVLNDLNEGDWVVAELQSHPLSDNKRLLVKITQWITSQDDPFAFWKTTLAKYHLDSDSIVINKELLAFTPPPEMIYHDLTDKLFFTIDNQDTEDMDDAISITPHPHLAGAYQVMIAIADPSSYILEGTELDALVKQRAFTRYLPGFSVPMLPPELATDGCSLKPLERRPCLICQVTLLESGEILFDEVTFMAAWIMSKAKLNYLDVSDWLEHKSSWQPTYDIAEALLHLKDAYEKRSDWRAKHELQFKERVDYQFIIQDGKAIDIVKQEKSIAHKMIEEIMIVANVSGAYLLKNKLGFGLFIKHLGYEKAHLNNVCRVSGEHNIAVEKENLTTLAGFCSLNQKIAAENHPHLSCRLRKYQTYAEISATPAPHFGLGLDVYATWTSPIRKYSDLINHRLIKSIVSQHLNTTPPTQEIITHINEQRKLSRLAEKDLHEHIYFDFLKTIHAKDKMHVYSGEVHEINRGGMRLKLHDNGAFVFIPNSFLHSDKQKVQANLEKGTITIDEQYHYRLGDTINVQLTQFKKTTHAILAKPINS